MELQDKKQTPGDFFSLYKDPPFPDSTPPSHGFFPKTRDFLQPLERAEASGGGGGGGGQRRAPPAAGAAAGRPGPAEHAPPGRFGACGPDHVRPTAVKPEWPACAAAAEDGGERRAEARRCAFTLWEEEVAVCPRDGGGFAGKGTQQLQQQQRYPPPSPFPAARDGANGRFPSFPPSREHQAQDKRGPMVAPSRSSRDFAEDDDEGEEDFGKEEKPYRRDLAVKVDRSIGNNGDNSSKDQTPTTPRSKHSATEQRRRTKINDRFQILRELIPHSDQKRDKASFLLEVIEYIQFLQEKVQKYESSCPGWNQANAKLMPWKSCQAPGTSIVDHSHIMKDHPSSTGFIFPADGAILNAPAVMSNSQNVAESENQGTGLASKSASMPIPIQDPVGAGGGFSQPQLKFVSDSESMAAQPHSRWLRSSVMDGSVGTDVLSGHEERTVDEGTNSLSSLYSERLLTTLTEALQHSGVDISQANISVQINLHRRTTSRRISGNKGRDDPISSNQAVHSAVGSSGDDESERARKKHKPDTS